MKTIEEKQLMQLEFLIQEFYPNAKVYQVDEVEERIYFMDGEFDMQAIVNRVYEEVTFKYKLDEDWYYHSFATFEKINEVNEAVIF